MGYLYKHTRTDKNEIFYIGIGGFAKDEKLGKYTRAYSSDSRNKYWYNITNKTNYIVEIIMENLSLEEAHFHEKEYIKLYGRKDINEGTLVNMTDGGEGCLGLIHSTQTIDKLRMYKLGTKQSEETKLKRQIKRQIYLKNQTEEEKIIIYKKSSKSNKGKTRKKDTVIKISKARAKLTKEGVLEIDRIVSNKEMTYNEISKIFGINTSCICNIVNRVSYKWVWEEI